MILIKILIFLILKRNKTHTNMVVNRFENLLYNMLNKKDLEE